jgi:hypothetical protein
MHTQLLPSWTASLGYFDIEVSFTDSKTVFLPLRFRIFLDGLFFDSDIMISMACQQ